MTHLLPLLKRGALSGLLAGALAGLFGWLLAEPVISRAIRLESARAAAAGTEPPVEVFSRTTQQLGLVVASCLTGLALGLLFAVLYAALHRTEPARDPWHRALRLGAALFFALQLVPFLRYPADPPGVGDVATVDSRTQNWLLAMAIGVVGVVAAGRLAHDMRSRGFRAPSRQLAVAGTLCATVALAFVLPGPAEPSGVPADLLWQFRMLSLATTALLWATLAASFGWYGERSSNPAGGGGSVPASDRARATSSSVNDGH